MRVRVGVGHGFSLIELLTVIMIIGVLSAITIPLGINYVRIYQVTAASQAVGSQMQYARSQAVRRNSRNGILLNFDYPVAGQVQFTTLDENPQIGGYDAVFPGKPPAAWNVPAPPNNVSPPHGPIILLPVTYEFVKGGTTNSLRFLSNGTLDEVAPIAGRPNIVTVEDTTQGKRFRVEVRSTLTDLSRVIRITQNGRITIEPPEAKK